MKAIVFDAFGPADVLRLGEAPMPEVRPSDLLVKVHAAGVNRAGLLQPGPAAVMESFVTAWEAAVHLGGTAQNTSILVHAAAGGSAQPS